MSTILVVDDEESVLRLFGTFFESRGYQTRVAHNGLEALTIVKSEPLGAVFLDLKMPEMDGVEALRLIREIDPDLPVVVVSGFATEDLARKVLKAGAFDFVAKPVVLSHLGKIVEQLEEVRAARSDES